MPAQTGSYSTDSFSFPPNYFFMYRTIDFCSAKSFLAHRNHILYFKIAHIKIFSNLLLFLCIYLPLRNVAQRAEGMSSAAALT